MVRYTRLHLPSSAHCEFFVRLLLLSHNSLLRKRCKTKTAHITSNGNLPLRKRVGELGHWRFPSDAVLFVRSLIRLTPHRDQDQIIASPLYTSS